MTVRKRAWRDPKGRARTSWMIDIEHTHADGTSERIRRTAPGSNRREAEDYERQLRAELDAARAKKEAPRVPTLTEFAEEFLVNAKANNKRSTAAEKTIIVERHLKPDLGDVRLDEIGARRIEAYKAKKLSGGLTPKTVNNHLSVLLRMLAIAREYELLDAVPRVRRLKEAEPPFDFLDFVEAERLLEAAANEPQWQRAIILSIHTGLRRGELIALRWDDVDLVGGRLVVRHASTRGHVDTPKSGRNREIPLSRRAVEILKAQRHARGRLVHCKPDGSPWVDDDFRAPLRRACVRAELRTICWKVLRHTFASHLVMRGASMKEVQELMGHSDIRVTTRYAHLSPAAKRNAVALLDAPPPHGT